MSDYKKTYEGDYIRSYKDLLTWKREAEIKRKEYQTISKKLEDRPYDKSERSDFHGISSNRPKSAADRVNADGSSNRSTTERRTKKMAWDDSDHYNKPKPKKEEKIQENKKEESTVQEDFLSQMAEDLRRPTTSPSIDPQAQRPTQQPLRKPKPTELEEADVIDDGNYNLYDYPIEEIGYNLYKNLKTGKNIDLEEAKIVLKKAGYEPKNTSKVGTILFFFIIANIAAPMFAPLIPIGYGVMKLMTNNTNWVKTEVGKVFKYSLPATEEEKSMSQRIGQISIGIGILFGSYRLFW